MNLDLGALKDLLGEKKKPVHKLKWGLPEVRLSAPLEDAEATVGTLKKMGLLFSGGGEYLEEVHYKDYGNNVFAYYILRTDKRSQEETVHFDGYMLQEEDRLGMDVTNAFTVAKSLEKIGYQFGFMRELEVWSFRALTRPVTVFEIKEAGDFIEAALPATKIASVRDKDEKWAESFFDKLKIRKEDVFPTDVMTLQLVSMLQPPTERG